MKRNRLVGLSLVIVLCLLTAIILLQRQFHRPWYPIINEPLPHFSEHQTPLMKAAMEGNTSKVKELLATGADVNGKDEDGRTALMRASFCGHKETVGALIAAGADVNARDNKGRTALGYGINEGDTQLLREAGAKL